MTLELQEKTPFLRGLECAERPAGFEDLRARAMAWFTETGLPRTKDEDWRFTSLRQLEATEFSMRGRTRGFALPDIATGNDGPLLVFVDGVFDEALSRTGNLVSGAFVGAFGDNLEIVERHLGRIVYFKETPFAALNTALFRDGAGVIVPSGAVIDEPIYICNVISGGAMSFPRALIVLGERAEAKVVESFVGIDHEPSFCNAVTEISLSADSVLEHVKLQLGSEEAFHITNMQTIQERASVSKSTTVTMGGKLVRNDTNARLDGQGSESTMNGLYVSRGQQHIDNHTRLEHTAPNCPSHELFKGVLSDKSSAVFNGKIIVRQAAQKTDSKQSNKNLLLSDDAVVNTKPQLEIFADDVRCTHGATIGRIDDDALFYFRSRGIPLAEARNLLIYAFASDVIERIRLPEVRERLEALLFERFATG